jgi:hypothetical protein
LPIADCQLIRSLWCQITKQQSAIGNWQLAIGTDFTIASTQRPTSRRRQMNSSTPDRLP